LNKSNETLMKHIQNNQKSIGKSVLQPIYLKSRDFCQMFVISKKKTIPPGMEIKIYSLAHGFFCVISGFSLRVGKSRRNSRVCSPLWPWPVSSGTSRCCRTSSPSSQSQSLLPRWKYRFLAINSIRFCIQYFVNW